jgi:signal transduction histidine kinase
VPLKSKDRVLGVITMASKGRRPFSPQEVTILTAIGQQIGVAIENARLYEQVQSMAALEERGRIGRELHDGLAQVLGYLHLQSRAAEGLLSSGQIAQAQAELQEMQEVAQEAYGDVRESILGLRTAITPGAGLIPTLTEYLDKFSQQSGINARLVIGDDAEMKFTPAAEIQLLRIVQEALANVRKHSQASRAWVRFEADEAGAVITIEDDGQGFDPSRIWQDRQGHFGLQTMRERVESVGGELRFDSQPGQGTRVVIRVPLAPEE